MFDAKRLSKFLGYFEGLPYLGLLVVREGSLEQIGGFLDKRRYSQSSSWEDLLANLALHQSTYIALESPISKELYDSIVQYAVRRGLIQIFDKHDARWKCALCDPAHTHLLLIAHERDLAALEPHYNFKEKVGLIEYV